MASIERKGGSWSVRYREGGRNRRVSGLPSQRAAQAIADEIARVHARGLTYDRARVEVPTWSEVGAAYVRHMEARVSRKTTAAMCSALDRFHAWAHGARLGELYLDSVTPQAVEEWHADLIAGRAPRWETRGTARVLVPHAIKPSTADQYARRVWAMREWARTRDTWRAALPDLAPPHLPEPEPGDEPDAPTWDECDRAIARAEGWVRDLFVILRCTGLRPAQAMALRWEHVDLATATMRLPPGHDGNKTRSVRKHGRILPIPPVLADELAGWGRRDGWIVDRTKCARKGHGKRPAADPDNRDAQAATLRTPWRLAGIRVEQPAYAFRKTHASGLAAAGVPMDRVDYLQCRTASTLGGQRYVEWWRHMEALFRADAALVPPIGGAGEVVALDGRREDVKTVHGRMHDDD